MKVRLKTLRPDILCLVLLFLLPLVFFGQQTLGGKTLLPAENLYQYEPFFSHRDEAGAPEIPHNHLLSDLVLQNYQWKSFTRSQLSQGEIPLWNPHQFSGIPFLAAGQHSALYPLSIIYYGMDLSAAYGWFTVINLWLAGAFMFGFLRFLGVGRAGATLAGVIYQFNGFVIASILFQMMIGGIVWLPLLLWMTEALITEKPLFGRIKSPVLPVLIGAAALTMNMLAGHVEITIYTLMITAYYAGIRLLWQSWQKRDARFFFTKAAFLTGMIALGLGAGAVQFVPLFEFVQTNWRAGKTDYDTVLTYAHAPRDILQFIMPNFYGSPVSHSYTDIFTMKIVTELYNAAGERINFIDWGWKNYVEGALYVGILPLLLAIYGLISTFFSKNNQPVGTSAKSELPVGTQHAASTPTHQSNRKNISAIFASLGFFSLTFMFGLPTYALLYALPGVNQLNSPFRWIYALSLCVAVLAAFGLDALQSRKSATVGTQPAVFARLQKFFGTGSITAGLLVFAGLVGSRIFYAQLEPVFMRIVTGMVKADGAFADAQMFYSFVFPQTAIFGVMLLLSGIAFLWLSRQHEKPSLLQSAFVIAIIVADLWLASWGFNPASDPALLDYTPPELEFLLELEATEDPFRYTTLEAPGRPSIMNANMGWRYGLDDIRGYDSIISKQYVDTMQQLAPQGQLIYNRIAPLFESNFPATIAESPVLDLLNVRYILAYPETALPDDSTWTIAREFPTLMIYENPDAVPRAYVITEDDFDRNWLTPDDIRISDVNFVVPENYTSVTINSDSGREKFIDVSLDTAAYLIISETYAPGWRTFVRPSGAGEDTEEAYDVVRFMGNFQAIELPAGDWTVRVVYSPASFQVGVFGSVVSIGLGTLLLGIWMWRVLVGVNTDDSSATARVARNSIAPILLNLFNRGIDFFFLLVMLRLLSPESVGVYYYLVVIFGWFDIFSNFGLDLYLIREVSREKKRAGHYFYNTAILRLAVSIAGIALLTAFILVRQATIDPALSSEALLTLGLLYLGLFPGSLNKGMTSLFYAFEQAEKPAAIATITSVNKAIFGVIVLLAGYGIVGLAGVSIINNIITFVVLLYSGRALIGKISQWRPDMKLIQVMLREGFPLLLNHFLQTIFFKIDIIVLEAMKGAGVVARYSIAYKWIEAINIIPAFFTQALLPIMSRQAQEDKHALLQTYRFGIKFLFAFSVPIAVGFTFMAEPLTFLMGGQQYLPDSAIAIQLMIWSIPIGWMNSLTQYALIALDLQRSITRAFFAAVGFNIIVNIIFIPQYGFQAAAIATIFSEMVLLVPFGILMHRGLEQPIGWMSLLWRPVIAATGMMAVTLLLTPVQVILALIVGSGVYLMIFFGLRPLEQHEIAILETILPGRITQFLL